MSEARKPARRSGQKPGGHSGRNTAPRQTRRPTQAAVDPARTAARDVLRAVRERDAYANLVLPALLRERKLDSRDAALATELTYGAARARDCSTPSSPTPPTVPSTRSTGHCSTC